jgi:hypothetical protein
MTRAENARKILSLDGDWQLAEGSLDAIPKVFDHQVVVPGLLSMAKPAFEGAGDGAADLVEVVSFGIFCFINFVKKAETVNVVGFASVGMMANQQTAHGRIRIGHIARGARGIGDGSPDSSKCMTSYPNWPVDVIESQPK